LEKRAGKKRKRPWGAGVFRITNLGVVGAF
jgi:hypothetical protein